MYKVLYRKYRPTNFDEVVGQRKTIELIKDSIKENKFSHAYIFSGPRGTGKTSTAKILAKTLNCINSKDGNPCGICEQCKNFNTSQDIYEIDAASNNGVDQIREIVDNVKLLPINSKYKIFIIDEVHMLSTSAFNALLLTLEEPPEHVIFILATTNIEAVPITVLSRCQRLDFKKISNRDIVENMRNICEKENITIDDNALEEIADYSDGGMRDALGLLDQLSKLNIKITTNVVQQNLGLVSNTEIKNLVEAIKNSNIEFVNDEIKKFKFDSMDYKTIIQKLIVEYKNLINNYLTGKLDYVDINKCKKICYELADTLNYTSTSINPFDLMEITILSNMENKIMVTNVIMNNQEKDATIDKTDLHINKSENENKQKEVNNKNNETNDLNCDNLVHIRVNNCFVEANKNFLTSGRTMWSEFINNTNNKKILGLIEDTQIVLCSNKYAIVNTSSDDLVNEFNINLEKIEKEFNNMFNSSLKIACISQNEWKKEMEEYKLNIKNNKKYTYIDETKKKQSKELIDVFDMNVVEIK